MLGLFSGPIALLYVGRGKLALSFVAAFFAICLAFMFSITGHSDNDFLRFAYWLAGPVVAFRCANSAKGGMQPWFARWFNLAGIAACAYGVVASVRIFLYEPYWIPSTDMLPTMRQEVHILVKKRPNELRRGEIILFKFALDQGYERISRVVGLPGDRITYSAKHLLVNGKETRVGRREDYLDLPFGDHRERYSNQLDGVSFDTLVNAERKEESTLMMKIPIRGACVQTEASLECKVPEGHYFVMGDNRDDCDDSRNWGFVPADGVIGSQGD